MNRVLGILAISVLSSSLSAQESPTTPKAAQVRILHGPEIELAKAHLTIINWTTNNPGGSPPALRNCALWDRSTLPDRDRKISNQIEPGSLIDGLPRTPR